MIGGNRLAAFRSNLAGQEANKLSQRRNCPLRRGIAITARISPRLGTPEGISVVCPA
jgi:hypothetical protein